ncbi:DeoR/GlpR family DNA-binding transcription regulator [Lentisphaerota bacterium ZTH]|nr:DeoR/GlpR transcriptional regulator [Lentisphaerota bacterium]WET05348.1 DeoR/GlpR family DNA-binding transcription regulator [Lentisphaerota bacterium ZTH]
MADIVKLRHEKIVNLLRSENEMSVHDLSQNLGVSPITIRRDLDKLSTEGLIHRRFGSAILNSKHSGEEIFGKKDLSFYEEKEFIGKFAASLVSEDDIVLMNSGSTVLHFLYSLQKHITVVTNNIAISFPKCHDDVDIILLGGNYRGKSKSLIGEITLMGLSAIRSSVTFLGFNGVHPEHGLSTSVHQEVSINKQMIKQSSGKIYVLADHSKLGKVSNFHTEGMDKIDGIITDSGVSKEVVNSFEENGVNVFIAE